LQKTKHRDVPLVGWCIERQMTYWRWLIKASSSSCASSNCSQKFPGSSICDTCTAM